MFDSRFSVATQAWGRIRRWNCFDPSVCLLIAHPLSQRTPVHLLPVRFRIAVPTLTSAVFYSLLWSLWPPFFLTACAYLPAPSRSTPWPPGPPSDTDTDQAIVRQLLWRGVRQMSLVACPESHHSRFLAFMSWV